MQVHVHCVNFLILMVNNSPTSPQTPIDCSFVVSMYVVQCCYYIACLSHTGEGKMVVLQVLSTVLLLVCWGALQTHGQQLGNAGPHCSINDY